MFKRTFIALAAMCLVAPAHAQSLQYRAADDLNNVNVSVGNPLPVMPIPGASSNVSTIYTAQTTSSAVAAALASRALVNGLVVTNDPASSVDVYVCPVASCTTAVGYKLVPGQSIAFGVSNASAIASITASGTSTLFVAGN